MVNWNEFFLYPTWGLFRKLSIVDTEKASFLYTVILTELVPEAENALALFHAMSAKSFSSN